MNHYHSPVGRHPPSKPSAISLQPSATTPCPRQRGMQDITA
ncbi:MAG: hypothetical protein ABH870_00925 [bacterium]